MRSGMWREDDDSDDEQAEDEKEWDTWPTDNVMSIIDARQPMFEPMENSDVPFNRSMEVISWLLRSKALYMPGDRVGVYLFGVSKWKEGLCESNVLEFQRFDQSTTDRMQRITSVVEIGESELGLEWPEAESVATGSSALAAAIRKCSAQLGKAKETDTRRIWLFTNDDEPAGKDPSSVSKLLQNFSDAQEKNVVVEIWHFPPSGPREFDFSRFYEQVLARNRGVAGADEGADVTEGKMDCSKPLDLLRLMADKKVVRKRRLARSSLVVPSDPALSIEVGLYRTVQQARRPQRIFMDRKTNDRLVTRTRYVGNALGAYLQDSDIVHVIEFLGRSVVVDKDEYKSIANLGSGSPGLHVLGFIPLDEVWWQLNVANATLVYPSEVEHEGSTKAFLALQRQMLARRCAALVRHNRVKSSAPRLAALVPAGADDTGFQLIPLPFADDVRSVALPPDAADPIEAGHDAVTHARKLVSKLALPPDRDIAGFANPALAKHNRMIECLALEREADDGDDETVGLTLPHEESMIKAAGKYITALGAIADSHRVVKKTQKAAAPKRKREEDDQAEVEELQSLEQLIASGQLNKLRVDDLKQLCRHNGLPVSGKKAQLVERLMAHGGGTVEDHEF